MSDVEVDLVGDLGALNSFSRLGKEGEGDGDDQQHRNDETLHGEHLCCSIDGIEDVYCGTEGIRGTFEGRRGGEREVVDELGYPARVSDRCRLGIEPNHVLTKNEGGQSSKAAFGKFKNRQHQELNITTSQPSLSQLKLPKLQPLQWYARCLGDRLCDLTNAHRSSS